MAKFEPVKRPGAATAQAKAEGISLSAWEQKHKNDPGRIGKEARFPLIAKKWNHKGKNAEMKSGSKKTARKRG